MFSTCLFFFMLLMWQSEESEESKVEPDHRAAKPYALRISGDRSMSVIATVQHDRKAFTQGLLFHDGMVIESTGLYGESTLRRVHPATGIVMASTTLENKYFGEGIVEWGGKIFMLTWREQAGFIFDAASLALEGTFNYTTSTNEGWGFTHNGEHMIVSDGSGFLHFWDPVTLKEQRRVLVKYQDGRTVTKLNELEFIPEAGLVLANVWYEDYILAIDPASGIVAEVLDFTKLLKKKYRTGKEDCFNGIAYDSATSSLYLTGKRWSKLFKLRWPGKMDKQSKR